MSLARYQMMSELQKLGRGSELRPQQKEEKKGGAVQTNQRWHSEGVGENSQETGTLIWDKKK